MKLKEAKAIFSKIVEICYEVDHPILSQALPSLEIDADKANSTEKLNCIVAEIVVLLEEAVSEYPDEAEALELVTSLQEELYD